MANQRLVVALGAVSAALMACSANLGPLPGNGSGAANGSGGSTPNSGGSSGKGPGTSGTTGGTGGGSTGGSGTGGGGPGVAGSIGTDEGPTCAQGIPTTTQIPRMLNRQYDAAVRDLLGVTAVGTDNKPPSELLNADFDGSMVPDAWRLYQDVGSQIAHQVMTGTNKSMFVNCDLSASDCLSNSIKAFGRKAFRRPMTDTEVSNFVTKLGQTNPAGSASDVAEAALYTFLVSPSFLLIPELSQQMEGTAYELSSYEVAARLSFLLWGSVPDDTLNAAADADMLQTKEQILAQAQRMVQVRDKTGPMVAEFHRVAWAQDNNTAISHWWKMDHDDNPLYNSALKPTYQAEIDAFFEDVAFSGGSFKDLFLSPVAFVTKDTAPIYGLDPSQYGTDFTRVELDPAQRPGFMTRIGFLSSYAHPDETSPILRGAFVTVHMIGVNPGAPQSSFTMTQIPPGTYHTNREQVTALVNTSSTCQGCHIPYVNPPGFALENYDSIGKWQTVDPLGGPIDATADVTFSADRVVHVTSPQQLMQEISITPEAQKIYAQLWVSYATGRDPNPNDECLVDDLDTKLSTDGYSVLNMLADVTQADSFRLRVPATP
jgi:hypothetical protein